MPPNSRMSLVLCAFLACAGSTAQLVDPRTLPLLQASDVRYLGSFSVPQFQGRNETPEEALMYGGWALGISPRGLYWGGTDWHDKIAEISIPTVGGTSTVLRPLVNVPNLELITPVSAPPSGFVLGGTLVHHGRLVVSAYVYYDAPEKATKSHFVADPALIGFSGPFALGGDVPGVLGGYMTSIPSEWQELFGGPALTGLCCVSIISRSSPGPSLSVFNPDDIGVRNPVPTTRVLRYTLEHPAHPDYHSAVANPIYNLATHITGVAFPKGTRSVIFVGRHGTGPYCYGSGSECKDPVDDSKGVHAYPYQHQLWFYDANDLLAVKRGTKRPYQPQPYAVMRIPSTSDQRSANVVTGGAYDPNTRRLYVGAGATQNPRVHVYEIGMRPTGHAARGDNPRPPGDIATNVP